MWNLEGMRIKAAYLDVPVSGRVTHSRVKYGGDVSHHLILDEPFTSANGCVTRPAGDVVLVSHRTVTEVRD